MSAPRLHPVGLMVAGAAKALARALDDELVAAGGSTPTWLVLQALHGDRARTPSELADAVGVRQPTMTHHLDTLERAGLVRRERDPADRRVQRVSSTPAGDAASTRLRAAATAVDRRLPAGFWAGFSAAEVDQLRDLLTRLAVNAAGAQADRDRLDPPAGAAG